jgi:hypothetical protein
MDADVGPDDLPQIGSTTTQMVDRLRAAWQLERTRDGFGRELGRFADGAARRLGLGLGLGLGLDLARFADGTTQRLGLGLGLDLARFADGTTRRLGLGLDLGWFADGTTRRLGLGLDLGWFADGTTRWLGLDAIGWSPNRCFLCRRTFRGWGREGRPRRARRLGRCHQTGAGVGLLEQLPESLECS